MDHTLADQVRNFVCDHRGVRSNRLRPETRLEEDLGMTGDDAAMFLEEFAEAFEVDLTGIEFLKHFGPEGSGSIFHWLWPRGLREEMKDHGNYPVTVGHLIVVADAKRWSCPPLHGEKKWPSL